MSQRILVTAALPYANGDLHIGHLVEYCQTDMYVRGLKRLGEAALYSVSAGAARMIQFILPGIGRGADALAPVVDSSVRQGFSHDDALPKTQTGPNSPDTAR